MKRNSSPKAKVLELASFCVAEGVPLAVRSTRVKGRVGNDFHVEVVAELGWTGSSQVLATACHRNWRTAYKLLGIQLSRRGVV
jgi:hypothetical protein